MVGFNALEGHRNVRKPHAFPDPYSKEHSTFTENTVADLKHRLS